MRLLQGGLRNLKLKEQIPWMYQEVQHHPQYTVRSLPHVGDLQERIQRINAQLGLELVKHHIQKEKCSGVFH